MGTQKFNSNIDVNGEVKGTSLDINGNADISGALTVNLNGDALNLRSTTNGQPANITFSTNVPDDQVGHIKYSHSNSASYAGGESFTIGGTETTTVILADGQLMYKDGIYSKPASGTGAGTRKDANWDTAYGWGNHASGGYLSTSGKAADSEKLDGLDSQEYGKVTPVGTWKSFTDPLTDTSGFIDSSWVNKFEFFDTSNILVETSTDDSTYTTTTEYSDAQLKNLMGGDGNAGINIPNLGTTGTAYKRFTFTASNYVSLSMLYEYVTRVSGTLEMKLEKRQVNTWTTVKDYTNVGGWPAHVALRHGTIWFNSNTTSTGHHWQVRVTIKGTTTNSSYPNHIINKLQWWGGYPSGRRNLFSTDSTKNATFPADLTVTGALTLGTLLAPAEGGTGLSSISTLLNSNVTSVSGNAGTVTNGVYTNATQTITGPTTFSNTLTADIKIKDTRSSGDVTPANFPTGSASFSFTDDFGGLGSWYSGITMKGWSGNYAAWQLISEANSSAADNNLYFRTGAASTWNSIRTVAMLDGTQTFSGAKTFTDTLALTGTGRITGIDTVSVGTDAANKTYVDNAVIANTDTQDLSIVGTTLSLTNSPDVIIPLRAVSDSVTSTSTTTAASSVAVKNAKDTANSAGLLAFAALSKGGGAMTGAITTNSTFDGVDIATRDAVLTSTTTTANAAMPKAGGAFTGAVTTNSTIDGVDIATRDGILSGTTVTANAALPKAGGTMTGDLTLSGAPSSNLHAATKAYVDGAVIANTDTNVDVSTLETRLGQINSSITIGNATNIVTTAAGPLTATGLLTAASSEIGRRNLDWAGTTDAAVAVNVQGDVIYHTAGTTTVPGEIYYMASNGNVIQADADTLASSTGLLMIALGTNATKGFLLRGTIQLRTNPLANPGAPIYLSTTLGRAQAGAPSQTGDVVRILGYQLTNTEESNAVYFNPDNTWVELT